MTSAAIWKAQKSRSTNILIARFETAVNPRLREKTCQDYEGMLRRYVRPSLGEQLMTALRPLDVQTTYHQMMGRGLSPRTIRYTHAVLRSAMRQALNWLFYVCLALAALARGVSVSMLPIIVGGLLVMLVTGITKVGVIWFSRWQLQHSLLALATRVREGAVLRHVDSTAFR